jgi:glycosyltransferase involved in cell wall biosynthesis
LFFIFKKPMLSDVPDRFRSATKSELNRLGIEVEIRDMWPNCGYAFFVCRGFPFSRRVFDRFVVPFSLKALLRKVRTGDWVWVNGLTKVRADTRCRFEHQLKAKGAGYIFWLEDDLLSVPYFERSVRARIDLADVVAVVTAQLRDRVLRDYPDKKVILVEEPIDPERTGEIKPPVDGELPVVAWTGRQNLFRVPGMADILARVYEHVPFKLRIVCGQEPPEFDFPSPWEWRPYRQQDEARSFDGALAGIATLEKRPYDECKGNYKVKTYMAMGLCPVVTRFGYNLDLIEHGETGFLADTDDEWVATLVDLLRNPEKAMRIGLNARRFVEETYTHEKIVPVWAEALRDLGL